MKLGASTIPDHMELHMSRTHYPINLTAPQLQTIADALQMAPYRIAAPILATLDEQVRACQSLDAALEEANAGTAPAFDLSNIEEPLH